MFSSPERRSVVLGLALAIATLLFYSPVTHNAFVNFDDNDYITSNPHVRSGLNWETVRWAFSSYDASNWHPLTWLSHALDWQIFGGNAAGHHYVNLLLHAANAVLLFLLLQAATGYTRRALMVGALFALHPSNVESVAWAAERKTVLSMLFLLLTMLAYGWYARNPGVRRYLAVAVLFALGLMAKPQIITLPLLLLLWDYWPLRRVALASVAGDSPGVAPSVAPGLAPGESRRTYSLPWLVMEKVPLLLLSLASALVTLRAQMAGGSVRTQAEYPLAVRLENVPVAYLRYIGKALWPSHLSVAYPHPGISLPTWQVIASVCVLLMMTMLVLWHGPRYAVVGWFWFLVTLIPMIGIVQVGLQAMADRYAYVSFIGLFIIISWGAAELAERRQIPQALVVTAATLVLLALGLRTYHQIGYWRNSESLWTHALETSPANYMAEYGLGTTLQDEGRFGEALPHFVAATAIRYDPELCLRLAMFEQDHGYTKQAIAHYQIVLATTSDLNLRSSAYSALGSAYRTLGDETRAKQNYEAALRTGSR